MTTFIQEKQTQLFDELGVFFAFSKEQFEEKRQEGVKYCTVLDAGDCVPVDKAKEFSERLSAIHKEGREKELAEKGIDKIIEEQLANYECYYTGDIDDALDAMSVYGVTREQVQNIYHKTYDKHSECF